MSDTTIELESRLARFIEHHVLHGTELSIDQLCRDRPDLADPLGALVRRYLSITARLDSAGDSADGNSSAGSASATVAITDPRSQALPQFEGFQTIERIGAGGMGEVYKLKDLRLDRIVAAKVIRADRRASVRAAMESFLQEARALALFSDRRIVQIFEFRADPPAIIMEFVDGFELGKLAPSLEPAQRARIMIEICEAVHHAHRLGLQHRDLKPSNIMLDARLAPHVLDFGLSAADPGRGHLKGTIPYLAPEQLDRAKAIDARADVYALGVILYEMLTGQLPYNDSRESADPARREQPRMPVEIDPHIPEPLQAIALAAMEDDPAARYQSALDMAADLRRFLEGRPVGARPSLYSSTLGARVKPHLDHVTEWLRLRLIYPHEADRLRAAYRSLEARDDDWIVDSRVLSYTQIALYLGAFLLLCGSIFYFFAARVYDKVQGIAAPTAVLGLPFIGLNAAAHLLYRKDHKAVAVAFYLAAVALLPLFLLIVFYETNLLVAPEGATGQLFSRDVVSNRQLQVTAFVACGWCAFLALRTRTVALSTVLTLLALVAALAVASDFGLRTWWDNGQWDRLSLHLFPLVLGYAALGIGAERTTRPWLSRPAFLGGAVLMVVLLELLALNGKMFEYLGGLSLTALQPPKVSDPQLLNTIAAMTINGIIFYLVALLLHSRGSDVVKPSAQLLFTIAPFAMLHPIGYLVRTTEYSPRFDWAYLLIAGVVVMLSEKRQRRSFYYAGLLNVGLALYLIAARRQWFDRPGWAIAIVAAGLATLGVGFALDRRARGKA
jgi:serine/threonine protein kinase